MNEKTLKILRSVFWAVLALVLLWFCFRGVDWAEFWKVIRGSRWGYVALAMAAGVFSFIFRALRWRLLILPVDSKVKRIDCYDGFTIGRLFNFVIPFFGEFVRCSYVQSRRLTYDKALGTVVLERTWDIFMLFLITVVLLVFRGAQFGSFFLDKMLDPAVARLQPAASRLGIGPGWLIAAIIVLAVLVAWVIFAVIRRRAGVAPKSKGSFLSRISAFFRGFGQGFSSFRKMKGRGWFLILTVLLWTMFLLMSWFIIKALPVSFGLTIVDALFIMLVGSLAGIVPVPGGFGAFHYIVAMALQALYGIPFETGIIFSTLSHESQAVTTILCGFLSYARRFLRH
jgi:hypothetical protein